jgi:hypothetical protein
MISTVDVETSRGSGVAALENWLRARLIALCAVLVVLAGLTGLHGAQRGGFNWPVVRSDGEGYYAYLPTWFIHRTLDFEVLAPRFDGEIPDWTGIFRIPPDGRLMNIYPIGVAVLLAPFFLLAHVATTLSGAYPNDGYSGPYQVSVWVGALTYLCIGLWSLAAYLARFFRASTAFWTVVLLAFGTSLFHYSTYDAVFSHVFTFCFLSLLLLLTARFWEAPDTSRAIALGAVCGILLLIRNYSAGYLLFVLLYPAGLPGGLREGYALQWRRVGVLLGTTALVAVPQMIIWKVLSGHFLLNSYEVTGLRFHFLSPHVLDVLFSFQKGVFVWAPLLLVAVVGLVATAVRHPNRELANASRLGLLLIAGVTYLIASWQVWHMGGGFGHRGFVDLYPLFGIGLAAALEIPRGAWGAGAIRVCLTVAVAVVNVLMLSYWIGRIAFFADATRDDYLACLWTFPERVVAALTPDLSNSRRADRLDARLAPDAGVETPPTARPGGPVSIRVTVLNTGRAYWLDAAPLSLGRVALGAVWIPQEAAGECRLPASPGGGRVLLPEVVRPGESVAIHGVVSAPPVGGRYVLLLEMVSEGVAWFGSGNLPVCREINIG